MTIIATSPFYQAGALVAAGSTLLNYSADVEADLVRREVAAYSGANPERGGAVPAMLSAVNGNTVLVGADGVEIQPVIILPSTVNSAEAAAENTSKIQGALTNAGIVQVLTPGTYYISDTLKLYSNTDFYLAPGVEIKLFAGTSKVMLTTESQYQTGVSVTLTWTAGTTVDIGWTAHGRAAGDFVWLLGASESTYRGVFRVDSVTDANSFKISLATTPAAAPSGTLTAKVATKNVMVRGGKWNSDYPNNAGAYLNSYAMSMYGCANTFVEDVEYGISAKFSLCFCAFHNAGASKIKSYNTQSDSVKVYGPGNIFEADNITGICGDDFMSIQPEEGTAYINYQIQNGDLHQIQVSSVNGKHPGSFSNFNVYLSDTCMLYGLDLHNVGGNALDGLGIIVQKSAGMTTGYAKRINISGVSSNCASSVYLASGHIDQLTIDGLQLNPNLLTNSPSIGFTATASVSRFDILRCNFSYGKWPSSGNASAITLTGIADLVNIDGCRFVDNGGGVCFAINLNTGISVKKINVTNCYHNSGIFIYVVGAPTVTPNVTLRGNYTGAANPVFIGGNINLSFSSNDFLNASSGVVRFNNTFTSTIKSDGTNNLIAGSWITVAAGTPVISLYGWDIGVDPIALTGLATTNGQYILSTQATTDGGPSVKTAAGWVALGTGASGVNTVIA